MYNKQEFKDAIASADVNEQSPLLIPVLARLDYLIWLTEQIVFQPSPTIHKDAQSQNVHDEADSQE